jgi:hypothetical protein
MVIAAPAAGDHPSASASGMTSAMPTRRIRPRWC